MAQRYYSLDMYSRCRFHNRFLSEGKTVEEGIVIHIVGLRESAASLVVCYMDLGADMP